MMKIINKVINKMFNVHNNDLMINYSENNQYINNFIKKL